MVCLGYSHFFDVLHSRKPRCLASPTYKDNCGAPKLGHMPKPSSLNHMTSLRIVVPIQTFTIRSRCAFLLKWHVISPRGPGIPLTNSRCEMLISFSTNLNVKGMSFAFVDEMKHSPFLGHSYKRPTLFHKIKWV